MKPRVVTLAKQFHRMGPTLLCPQVWYGVSAIDRVLSHHRLLHSIQLPEKNLEIFSRASFGRSFGDFGIFNKSPAFRVSFNRCPGVIAESYWVTEPTNPNLIVVGPRGAIVVCFKSLNSREKKKTTNRFHAHRLTVFTILCLEGPRRTQRHLSGIVWLKIKPKNSTAIPFRIA